MFLIPIYSEQPHEYAQWIEKNHGLNISDPNKKRYNQNFLERCKENFLERTKKEFGFNWEFNRAVGWIYITRAIDGFNFKVAIASSKKRHQAKKNFSAIELMKQPNAGKSIKFNKQLNASEIVERFEEIFNDIIKNHVDFRGCYVDSTSIKNNAQFIDWKAVLETPF